jgi:hypothetical protein
MAYTNTCYNCKMTIPHGAIECPYCHTRLISPPSKFSSELDLSIGIVCATALITYLTVNAVMGW